MKTIISVFAISVVLAGLAVADDNTHVSNQSSQGLNAIVSCQGCQFFVTCSFHIAQEQIQDCSYLISEYDQGLDVTIELWVDGAGVHNNVNVAFDQSIVAYNNPQAGVDIYLAASGTDSVAQPPVLVTIYDN